MCVNFIDKVKSFTGKIGLCHVIVAGTRQSVL